MDTEPFSDQLRRSVAQSGLSRYRIAKEIGVSQATLSRFMAGTRGLSMEVTDRLFALLGLSIAGPEATRQGE
jgi:transcriptional regulator with XRE-family HTH domain